MLALAIIDIFPVYTLFLLLLIVTMGVLSSFVSYWPFKPFRSISSCKEFILTTLKKTSYALIRNLIKQIVVYDDKIEIFYYYTSKNPNDNGRDFTLIEGSDKYPLVCLKRDEYAAQL